MAETEYRVVAMVVGGSVELEERVFIAISALFKFENVYVLGG